MGASAAVAGLSGASLAVPTLADSEVEVDAQGDISLIIVAGVVVGSAPIRLAMRVIFPTGQQLLGKVQILRDPDGSVLAEIPFSVESVITTRSRTPWNWRAPSSRRLSRPSRISSAGRLPSPPDSFRVRRLRSAS
jgi:hypothetical protein